MEGYKVPARLIESYIEKMYAFRETNPDYFGGMNDIIESIEALGKEELDNPWHTGTPTETGEYLVCRVPEAGYLFRYNQLCVFSDLMGTLDHKIFYIGEVGKNSFENITDSVIAWQKIKPYKEEKKDG